MHEAQKKFSVFFVNVTVSLYVDEVQNVTTEYFEYMGIELGTLSLPGDQAPKFLFPRRYGHFNWVGYYIIIRVRVKKG